MASKADKEFLIRVRADIQQAVRDMQRMTKDIKAQGKAGQRSAKQVSSLGPAYTRLAKAAAAYLTIGTAIRALKMADEFRMIEVRLQRATAAQGDYNRVSQQIYDIAQRNGTALRDTADLFINLTRSAQDLGGTRDQVLAVTNAIQQLGVLSGASATELSNALRQFSQSMAGGVVRAEEFNSIVENTPAIAERIARGMGMTVGQLRLAVINGNVLSKQVFESLLSQSKEINTEFESAPQSLEASANRMSNAFGKMLTRLDKTLQATQTLKDLMDGVAILLDKVAAEQSGNEEKLQNLLKKRLDLYKQQREIQHDILWTEQTLAKIGPDKALQRDLERLQKKARDIKQQILDNNVLLTIQNQQATARAAPTDAGPSTSPPPAPSPTIDKTAAARKKSIDQIVQSLQQEADTYGQSAEQIALYRLQVEGATEAQLAKARAAIKDIQAQREFDAANKAAIDQAKQQAEEQAALNAKMDQQAQRWRDLLNPMNAYQRQIEEIERLYNAGKISAETYAEATFHIQDAMEAVGDKAEKTGEQVDQFAVQAARNIQDQLGDTLYNIADTSFKGILRSWVDMLRKMASEALAAQIGKKLLGDSFGKSGDIGGIIGSIFSGLFHTGGIVGETAGPMRMVSPLLFANAPRYHTGGLIPGEVPIIAQKGEEILARNDPRNARNGGAAAGGGSNGVRIVNVIDPAMVQDYMTSSAGEDTILNVLSRRRSDVQSIVR